MWLPRDTVDETLRKVRVYYVDQRMTRLWNRHRAPEELRLLTGWTWVEKGGAKRSRIGIKSRTMALRDAYYAVVREQAVAPMRAHRAPRLADLAA